MSNLISEECARKLGRVLAFWQNDGWHAASWTSPDPRKYDTHWCIENKWTPGAAPIAFMPMPPTPDIKP